MALADILSPSCVEVGKIKVGTINPNAKKRDGSTYSAPVKLDHFWVSTLHRDKAGVLIPDTPLMESLKQFADADGKLRQLPVMFGSNNPDDVMQASYVWYDGKQLAGRSDGREVVFNLDPKTGQRLSEPRVEKWSDQMLGWPDPKAKNRPLFKLYCSLNVMIASPAARWGGFYRFRTTSEISSRQLYGSLDHLRKLTGGVLRGLVFRMVVRPMLVTPGGQTATVHVVHVEYVNSDLKQLQAAAREQLQLEQHNLAAVLETERQYKQLVAAQVDEEPDEDLVAEEPKALPAAQRQPQQQSGEQDTEAMLGNLIDQAETPLELADAWQTATIEKERRRISLDAYKKLASRKDKKKAQLATPAAQAPGGPEEPHVEPADPDPEDTPVEPTQPDPEPEPQQQPRRAGKAIVEEISRLCVELSTTWLDVRAEYAEALGISSSRIVDLSPEQATRLRTILKQRLADPVPAGS